MLKDTKKENEVLEVREEIRKNSLPGGVPGVPIYFEQLGIVWLPSGLVTRYRKEK